MSLSLNNLTFIIVTFKSEHIIHECLSSLPKNSKIIVIENSNNEKLKRELETRYSQVQVFVQENMGMGKANNQGIKLCDTDYAFVINPDVKFEVKTIQLMIDFTLKKDNYAVLAPISDNINYPNYKIKNKKFLNDQEDYLDVDSVDGYAMLINKKKFENDIYFDENFFLYLENEDLCLRKKIENEKIYVLKTAKINHLGGKSPSAQFEKEVEYSRNWHWMWSKFYFNKKNFGLFRALTECLPSYISSIFKFLFYLFINNKNKKKIYFNRISGFYNALMNKPSWYRPKINN